MPVANPKKVKRRKEVKENGYSPKRSTRYHSNNPDMEVGIGSHQKTPIKSPIKSPGHPQSKRIADLGSLKLPFGDGSVKDDTATGGYLGTFKLGGPDESYAETKDDRSNPSSRQARTERTSKPRSSRLTYGNGNPKASPNSGYQNSPKPSKRRMNSPFSPKGKYTSETLQDVLASPTSKESKSGSHSGSTQKFEESRRRNYSVESSSKGSSAPYYKSQSVDSSRRSAKSGSDFSRRRSRRPGQSTADFTRSATPSTLSSEETYIANRRPSTGSTNRWKPESTRSRSLEPRGRSMNRRPSNPSVNSDHRLQRDDVPDSGAPSSRKHHRDSSPLPTRRQSMSDVSPSQRRRSLSHVDEGRPASRRRSLSSAEEGQPPPRRPSLGQVEPTSKPEKIAAAPGTTQKTPRTLLVIWMVIAAELGMDLVTTVIAFTLLLNQGECCGIKMELGLYPLAATIPFLFFVLLELAMLLRAMYLTMWPPSLETRRKRQLAKENASKRCGCFRLIYWTSSEICDSLNWVVLINPFFGAVVAWLLLYQSNKTESFAVLGLEAASLILHYLSLFLEGTRQTVFTLLLHSIPVIPFFIVLGLVLTYIQQKGVCYLVEEQMFWYEGCQICEDGNPPVDNKCWSDGTLVEIDPFDSVQETYCSATQNFCFFPY